MKDSDFCTMDARPSKDGLTSRQALMVRWQALIAFGPFMAIVLLAVTNPPMPHWVNAMPGWTLLPILIIPVAWAVAFKGYLLYLDYQK